MSMRTQATAASMVVVAAIAAATAIPALTGAQTSGAREITVRMKVRGGTQIQHRKSTAGDTLAPGDAVLVRLSDVQPQWCRAGLCVQRVRQRRRQRPAPFNATLQCVQTYRFKDGQIVTAGVVRFSQLEEPLGPDRRRQWRLPSARAVSSPPASR